MASTTPLRPSVTAFTGTPRSLCGAGRFVEQHHGAARPACCRVGRRAHLEAVPVNCAGARPERAGRDVVNAGACPIAVLHLVPVVESDLHATEAPFVSPSCAVRSNTISCSSKLSSRQHASTRPRCAGTHNGRHCACAQRRALHNLTQSKGIGRLRIADEALCALRRRGE